jgi:hypothetical protein
MHSFKHKLLIKGVSLLTSVVALTGAVEQPSIVLGATDSSGIDRTVLPIKEPTYPESTVLDARDAKAPPRFEVKAPAKAPNVVIVLIDDIGFGASSAFGGPINMPTLDKLAAVVCVITVFTRLPFAHLHAQHYLPVVTIT